MNKIDKLKAFLQKNYPNIQAFNSRNTAGDILYNVYNQDGIQVDYCPYYDYVEIFGISEDEYDKMVTEPYNILKTFKIKGGKSNE